VRDGVAIAAYIAEHVLRRGARETGLGVSRLAARLASRRPRGQPDDRVRLYRAARVATAAATIPVLLGAAVVQALFGRLVPDLVTPLVRRLYSADRLTAKGTHPTVLPAVALATPPLRRP
jgi:hypothetical protein